MSEYKMIRKATAVFVALISIKVLFGMGLGQTLREKDQFAAARSELVRNCDGGGSDDESFLKAFSWADVDFSIQASCGTDKCFWPSVANPNTGYIITQSESCKYLMILRKSITFAQHIEKVCGSRHLFAKNFTAVSISVTKDRAQTLIRNVYNPSRETVGKPSPKVYDADMKEVTVIKVLRAPTESILYGSKYGTHGTKWESMMVGMPSFRQKLKSSLPEIRKRLHNEKESLECALKEAGTCYWVDLQGIIDTHGRYYHIDLDEHIYQQTKHPEYCHKQAEPLKQKRSVDEFQSMIDILTEPQS